MLDLLVYYIILRIFIYTSIIYSRTDRNTLSKRAISYLIRSIRLFFDINILSLSLDNEYLGLNRFAYRRTLFYAFI